jgi:hypothetical protein
MADPHTTRGNADEIHQDVRDDDVMTTQQGSVVYDDQNSLRAPRSRCGSPGRPSVAPRRPGQ